MSRCEYCMMASATCICESALNAKKSVNINANQPVHICLLMHNEEAYKPTNTGRLIEHVLPDITHRFYWHRTEPDEEFLALLKDENVQPYIIFPGDRGGYDDRVVEKAEQASGKIPLFINLDGSWRQAGRMFRLSNYLQDLPV